MSDVPIPLPFLDLANKLFHREVTQADLASLLIHLPLLDESTLLEIGVSASDICHSKPRLAWELCHLAYKTSVLQNCPLYLRSLAALQMARAAATWEQPQKLAAAIKIARKGFGSLHQPGWLAACSWVAASLPLAQNDFAAEEVALKEALQGLQQANMEKESYLCRLDLAWQQNLLGIQTEAENNLRECEEYFAEHSLPLLLARCWRLRSRIFIKAGQFAQAAQLVEQARSVYQEDNSLLGLAYLARDEGILYLYSTTDYEKTHTSLETAASLLKQCELALSRGEVLTYLASLNLQVGNLNEAKQLTSRAKNIFSHFHVILPYTDCLTLQGLVLQEQGDLENAIANFQQAYSNHKDGHNRWTLCNDLFNLGNAYAKAGRYQLALQSLESAVEMGKNATPSSRLGLVELYLARVWLQLKNHPIAIEHVDRAEALLNQTKQADSQVTIARLRAKIFLDLGNQSQALSFLTQALNVASQNNIPTQTALSHRLLGEVFLNQQDIPQAEQSFQRSFETFKQLNMQLEQANCLLSLARAALIGQDLPLARERCRQALDLSRGDYSEVEWRARSLLAEIEQQDGQPRQALSLFSEANQYHSRIQRQFWQPAVAGTYAQEPAQMFENAVLLASRLNQPESALQFMEAEKANTLVNQLSLSGKKPVGKKAQELDQLRTDINWIQNQMQVNLSGANLQTLLQMRSLRKDLQLKSRRYETLVSQLERENSSQVFPVHEQLFSLRVFRESANALLGQNWLALDYHMVDEELIIVVISRDAVSLQKSQLNARFFQALTACQLGAGQISQSDLEVLGKAVLPASILESVTSETVLLLSPHKGLHMIPWAAVGESPLSTRAVPCVVPSLHTFCLLNGREVDRRQYANSSAKNGLLLGFSHFTGRHPELPYVKQEIAALRPMLGPEGLCYQDEAATREILARIDPSATKNGPELRLFNWMHVASHFFSDPASGYLSGVALTDQPLWLDQIRSLAPLPGLVSFSGCSSIYSRLYDGDEAIGLPSTCLINGSQSVIGSVWPVQDESSARLMTHFYRHILAGLSPAHSLAYAQRELSQAGDEPSAWAGYICLGLP